MQRDAIPACNTCRLSNVLENIHEAKVLHPMTAFGGITLRSRPTCVDVLDIIVLAVKLSYNYMLPMKSSLLTERLIITVSLILRQPTF